MDSLYSIDTFDSVYILYSIIREKENVHVGDPLNFLFSKSLIPS
jgi:hypothetical protein